LSWVGDFLSEIDAIAIRHHSVSCLYAVLRYLGVRARLDVWLA
jgi:hypothetical protein